MKKFLVVLLATSVIAGWVEKLCVADSSSTTNSNQQTQDAIANGIAFLRNSQAADGTFTIEAGPGITALALTGAIRCGESLDSEMVTKGLKALESYVKPDGGIYGNGRLKNYETCISIICFVEANQSGKYNEILQNARKFVTEIQYGTAGATEDSDVWNGGVGYGGNGRPDLSNTAYMIEALKSLDAPADDPAIQNALAFVSRCQNLDSEFNDTQFAGKINDGSFYYEIPKGKFDPSSDSERYTDDGGIRGYGSMTYSGYKSMIYAGLTDTDPRVQAAMKWIATNYTVDRNPNMGEAGLYYYYHTFSAALSAAGVKEVKDADGITHNWRDDLVEALAKRQNQDGSWSNDNKRWFENDKNLSTAFALLSLAKCR